MELCLNACDSTSGCIDVAYAGKYCYLKNSLTPGQSNSGVWGAKLVSNAGTTSSATSSVAVSIIKSRLVLGQNVDKF